jgi:hypothetical protein
MSLCMSCDKINVEVIIFFWFVLLIELNAYEDEWLVGIQVL